MSKYRGLFQRLHHYPKYNSLELLILLLHFFEKWANTGLFSFIFKHKFYSKTAGFELGSSDKKASMLATTMDPVLHVFLFSQKSTRHKSKLTKNWQAMKNNFIQNDVCEKHLQKPKTLFRWTHKNFTDTWSKVFFKSYYKTIFEKLSILELKSWFCKKKKKIRYIYIEICLSLKRWHTQNNGKI